MRRENDGQGYVVVDCLEAGGNGKDNYTLTASWASDQNSPSRGKSDLSVENIHTFADDSYSYLSIIPVLSYQGNLHESSRVTTALD